MMPNVRPAGTLNETPFSVGKVSSGCKSWIKLPFSKALLRVANCFLREYLR